jgi:hypothetical protein
LKKTQRRARIHEVDKESVIEIAFPNPLITPQIKIVRVKVEQKAKVDAIDSSLCIFQNKVIRSMSTKNNNFIAFLPYFMINLLAKRLMNHFEVLQN